jgi:hypothetical protein
MGVFGCVCLWVSLSTSTSVRAQPVTVALEAVVVVSDASDFIVGETVDLTYTFETSTPDSNPEPNQGFYSNTVISLTADFRTSGRSFTFGTEPLPISNFALVLNDDDASTEFIDVLNFMNSSPEQTDTVNGMNPAILQLVFSDSRTESSPTMLDDDTIPVSAFPYSFALVQFLDPAFMSIGTVVAVPTPNLPDPDDLPIFEETVPNQDGEFEILDAEQNVVGTAFGDLALAAGVAADPDGNQFLPSVAMRARKRTLTSSWSASFESPMTPMGQQTFAR